MAAIGEIGAGLVHELNQPLTALAIYSEGCQALVRGNPIPLDDLYTAATNIHSAVLRAGTALQRLQDLSRRCQPRRATLRIVPLIDDAVRAARRRLAVDDVVHSCRHASVDAELVCDGLAVQQAVLELVANAYAALESWTAARRVDVATRAESGSFVIEVRDSGPGLPAEVAADLADRARASDRHGRVSERHGLSIALDVARAHGGACTFAPADGGGTLARLVLPSTTMDSRGTLDHD